MNLSEVEGVSERWSASNKLSPIEIRYTSVEVFEILCLKCEQYSLRKAKDIFKNPDRCGVCAGKIVIPGYNDVLSHHPWLNDVWDYEKNELAPETYSKTSGKKVWIKCKACKQSLVRQISNLINNPNGCSVCSGKIVIPGINDLASTYLINEWSPKNRQDPTKITARDGDIAQWICRVGHEYEMAPGTRVLQKQGCPYCANQKVLKGFNDLSTTRPELLKEWDTSKNTLKPTEITAGSNKQVWWLCKDNHSNFISPNQKWDTKNSRIRICKDCLRGHQSYGEQELLEFLQNEGYTVQSSIRGVVTNGEIDCYIPELKIGFEFNGDYWHSDEIISGKYSITAETYHKRKKDSAEDAGVQLYFVWASDWYANTKGMKQKVLKAIVNNEVDPDLEILSKG